MLGEYGNFRHRMNCSQQATVWSTSQPCHDTASRRWFSQRCVSSDPATQEPTKVNFHFSKLNDRFETSVRPMTAIGQCFQCRDLLVKSKAFPNLLARNLTLGIRQLGNHIAVGRGRELCAHSGQPPLEKAVI